MITIVIVLFFTHQTKQREAHLQKDIAEMESFWIS